MNLIAPLQKLLAAITRDTPITAAAPVRRAAGTSYQGAKIDRLNKDWVPGAISGDSALLDSWPLLTSRVRDLIRNEPALLNAKRKLTAYLVGTGIATFAAASINGEADDDYNFESDEWFDRWAEEEADVEGKQAWPELLASLQSETIETGDGFLLKVLDDRPGRSSPLAYQLIEAEQLDESQDRPASPGQNKIVRGVEIDSRNRPVAYWIYDAHPYDSYSGWTTKSTRVPADRVIHYFVPFRPSMSRGVNWFHAVIQPSRDVDTLIGSELTTAIVGSLFSVMITRAQGSGSGLGFVGDDPNAASQDANGNSIARLGRGIIFDGRQGDDVKQIQSNRPSPLVDAFVKLLRQQQSMGVGLSYLRLTADYSSTSYTSARGAHLDDQAYFLPLQLRIGRRVVLPVRRAHNALAVSLGRITSVSATQFARQPFRWQRFDLQPPGREQLDPEMETDASAARIRTGISTLKEENALKGKNWRKVLAQRALEQREIKRLGLETTINFSKGGGAPERESSNRKSERQTASAN